MAAHEEKDSGRTVVHGASTEDAALETSGAATTGGDGAGEKGTTGSPEVTRAAAEKAPQTPDAPVESSDPAATVRIIDPAAGENDTDDIQHELSRRERERLMRRQLMLDAARAVFAEKGYADATLDEVATRAEFGKGTLYNYFEGGKEEILFAIFDDLYDALCRLVDATLSPELVHSSPFREVFEGFLTAIFAFFLDREDQFMILVKEGHRMLLNEQPEKALYFQKQDDRVIDVIVKGIEAAQQKGELRPLPATAMASMIMGNVKGYHMHQCMEGCRSARGSAQEPVSPEKSASFLASFLLDGLLAPSAT